MYFPLCLMTDLQQWSLANHETPLNRLLFPVTLCIFCAFWLRVEGRRLLLRLSSPSPFLWSVRIPGTPTISRCIEIMRVGPSAFFDCLTAYQITRFFRIVHDADHL